MFRILESQAPTKQNATDTINTLGGRLNSATLVEDRRAAILGLRSFAKLYPASVASGALRNLINSLNQDGEDVDTTKIVLETLLMLFNPDESSPEASDDIALWLADEFTQVQVLHYLKRKITLANPKEQRQENITVLLDLLDRHDFFSRLYSLQLISAISTARLERTQECVYTAPLGVSRLVAILDDKREAVRTEGLLLLVALTDSSPDLQKLVPFENAFDRVFSIIDAEGSLTHGGVVVQDCLSLLANLLRFNASNQSFFRETGGVGKIAAILGHVLKEEDSPDGVPEWVSSQRDKNLWGLLSVMRLFLLGGNASTQVNQMSLWNNGVAVQVLKIAFHASMAPSIRAEALLTCADLIRGNAKLQELFAQRDVTLIIPSPSNPTTPITNGNGQPPGVTTIRVNVVQGLLDLALAVSSNTAFSIRFSACECIKAYLYGHAPIKMYFLKRARDGHTSETYEDDNILTILLEAFENGRTGDPYRIWIAAVLLFHLLYEDYDSKHMAMQIADGNADQGEEVVTCIQTLSGNLVTGAQKLVDDRISIGYLMILCGWLYEDPDAVNDFLGEGSNVQSLIQMVLQPSHQKGLVAGLCAFLLGIIYEFSTKDSPIPRSKLHEILTTSLGREQMNDKMTKLREHPLVRDFEVLQHGSTSDQAGSLPDIYLDKTFVDFLKDNFSRVIRAIDRDPGIEVSVVANGVQKGISRELVDSLKSQLEDRTQALQKAEAEILTLERRLGQEQADHRKSKESASIELARIKTINENLQKHHEEDVQKLQVANQRSLTEARQAHDRVVQSLQTDAQKQKQEHESKAAKARSRHEAEMQDAQSTVQSLQTALEKSNKDHAQDLRTAHEEYSSTLASLESRLKRAEERAEEAEARAKSAAEAAKEAEQGRASVQTELDDLLMVLGDIEEKRDSYKARLKALGESVTDGEDEEEEGGDE